MALDPIYISLPALEDFAGARRRSALSGRRPCGARDGAVARRASQHRAVRALKATLAAARVRAVPARRGWRPQRRAPSASSRSPRDEAWWLDDYALFQALRGVHALRAWWEWPEPLARRHERRARACARRSSRVEIGYRKYVQWMAAEQWARARREAAPVQVFGDVPFMISADSPDVWTRAARVSLRRDRRRAAGCVQRDRAGLGPAAVALGGDGARTTSRGCGGARGAGRAVRRLPARSPRRPLSHVHPAARSATRARSSRRRTKQSQLRARRDAWCGIYQESGAEIIAEDLGTVPDFVRASLRRLGVPGFKVLRWERHWAAAGAAVHRSVGVRRESRSRRPARTTPSRWPTWWDSAAGRAIATLIRRQLPCRHLRRHRRGHSRPAIATP